MDFRVYRSANGVLYSASIRVQSAAPESKSARKKSNEEAGYWGFQMMAVEMGAEPAGAMDSKEGVLMEAEEILLTEKRYNDYWSIEAGVIHQHTDRGRHDDFHFIIRETGLFGDDLNGFFFPILIARDRQKGSKPDMWVDLEIFQIT
jgi:hypothetical protein